MKKLLIKTFFVSLVFFGTGYFVITVMATLSQVSSGMPLNVTTWNDMIGNFFWKQNGTSIYYTGNVGIGTINPTAKISIYTNANNTPSVANSNIYIRGSNQGGGLVVGTQLTYPVGSWIQTTVNDGVGSTPLLLQPSGGNVGIGTTNPTNKLEVAGTLKLTSPADIVTSGIGHGLIVKDAGNGNCYRIYTSNGSITSSVIACP